LFEKIQLVFVVLANFSVTARPDRDPYFSTFVVKFFVICVVGSVSWIIRIISIQGGDYLT
jgi:preprotein translocase subunit Sss1